jgi:monoterpene epsilon-lactone hydrolase
MPSLQSKVLEFLLQVIGEKERINRIQELTMRGKVTHVEPPGRLFRDYHVTSREVNGENVWVVSQKAGASHEHIYYLHGGSYVYGFARQHWRFMTELVDAVGCTVVAPDYPRPPEHHVRDVFAMILPVYENLVATVGAINLTVMGDSAGGGMSLALAQLAREKAEGCKLRRKLMGSPLTTASLRIWYTSGRSWGYPSHGKPSSKSLKKSKGLIEFSISPLSITTGLL